ncbi:hypothetical protein GJU41_00155 [Bacillus idriensis]|uniref:Uncharacterized protein n=1 Tax=Metabacillus idriensis TaxID=324768 RepID=A0A6I2M472_9BACI|nr:hypothetical protein [Metabacillus idriensis]MRX52367.1 hypothetical protein [Metabacillus idriensis]
MTEYKFQVKQYTGGGYSLLTRTVKVEDCANLVKEHNGESNWCLLKDAHCPLLAKHDRYNFDPEDIKCSHIESGFTKDINKLENPHREEVLNSIVDEILAEREAVVKAYPDNGKAVYQVGKYLKTCKRCETHFKTDAKNKVYCEDCSHSMKKQKHRKYNGKRD